MKRIVLLLSLLLLVAMTVKAQRMSVGSFKLLPNDNSALQDDTKRIDQNGKTAALIKIITSERGFGFEGGALGVVDAKQLADQVLVWVPYGLRKIVIKHPLYGVLRDYRFPVEIQEGRTYELVLNIEKTGLDDATVLTKQYLSFRVTPSNAVLEVEEDTWPLDADGVAERVVEFGTYHYWVHADNYQTDAGIIKVNDPDKATVVTVNLLSSFGWIEFVSTSSSNGAEVFVDNAKIGTVPCKSKELTAGNHEVELRKTGFGNLKQSVAVKQGETTTLSLEMRLEQTATFMVNNVSFVMKLVPGGEFMMGGTDRHAEGKEKPAHKVTVSPFFIGETEVTQELWNAVMNENPSKFKGNRLPVETVTWENCQEFVYKLSKLTDREFRLPTEAEWEYAARGGTKTSLYNGEEINIKGQCNAPNLDNLGWYSGNCGRDFTTAKGCDVSKGSDISQWEGKQYPDRVGGSHPVKQKQPNAYGLYDMLGNVMEWCNDWYGSYEGTPQKDPKGPKTGTERVNRGGSWYRDAEEVRVSSRNKFAPNGYTPEIGLRLALSINHIEETTEVVDPPKEGNAAIKKTSNAPVGALDGKFSVSETQQVYFSQGNLQYHPSNNKWVFASEQYEYIGEDNKNVSRDYNGWIDLFSWGASGYEHGAVCYQPYNVGVIRVGASYYPDKKNYYAYGIPKSNLNDQDGKADWGYNAIVNGGSKENFGWRTLTKDELVYVFEQRKTKSGIRYAKAQVNGVRGVILLPDDWERSYYKLKKTNKANADFIENRLDESQWDVMESHGAVFLPAAGSRLTFISGMVQKTDTGNVNNCGCYWTATASGNEKSYCLYFGSNNFDCHNEHERFSGYSVRLVIPAK